MPDNRVDLTLSAAQRTALDDALASLRGALAFLEPAADAAPAQLRMGDKGLAFSRRAVEILRQHPEAFPSTLDPAAVTRDLDLYDALERYEIALRDALDVLSSARASAGAEAYTATRFIYSVVKADPAFDALARELAPTFARRTHPSA